MKKFGWPILILVLSVAVWLSTIKVSPIIAKQILAANDECEEKTLLACNEVLSALGATGDIFGAMTSLFSGLALFAVSYTLWSDANARRESKKPLVTNYLDNNSITIKNPKFDPTPEIDLSVSSTVSNRNGEAALNVSVYCQIKAENQVLGDFKSTLRQPLVSEGTEEFEVTIQLKGNELAEFLSRLTQDKKPISFLFEIVYSSLENVHWQTTVTYDVSCKAGDRRRRLNSIRSATEDFSTLWENGAQVSLDAEVHEGSWFHHRK